MPAILITTMLYVIRRMQSSNRLVVLSSCQRVEFLKDIFGTVTPTLKTGSIFGFRHKVCGKLYVNIIAYIATVIQFPTTTTIFVNRYFKDI